jgi:tetratricopeptide (TPR) repeat protein
MSKLDQIADLFQKGSALHQQNNFVEAQAIYEKILCIQPDHFDVLQLLGSLLAQIKKHSEAIKYLSKALKINPNDARTQCNQGIVLKELKRFDEALSSYNQAIAIEPYYADAFNNRGIVLQELKRFDEALSSYNQAIAIEPKFAQAYYNRGIVLQELKRFDEALDSYDQAISINSNFVNAYNNKGVILKSLKRFDEALSVYNQAISIKPDYSKTYYNQGIALQELNRHDEALISYDQAIAINPDYPEAYNNVGNTLQELKQFDKALVNYNHAISIDPDYADAFFNKSTLLILRGDYSEGWQLYEWRWKQKHNINSRRHYKKPLWLGNESLIDKTLLITIEQGFGDYIQFIRYALLVQKLDVKVILEVPSILISVVATLKGQFTLVETGKPLPDFDYHCPVASLPLAFKTTLKSIPGELPYLYANENCKKKWGKKLGKKTITRIGLVWAGNPDHTNDYNRSLLLKQFSSLLTLPFEFHSLQKDLREVDAQTLIDFPDLYQHQDELHDFSDTAALIDAMDIIISVDTSVAHLAGAMGKKLWLLLPYLPDFRWMLDREDSPWYPCAILYRQKKINDWDSALEKLKADLLKLTN